MTCWSKQNNLSQHINTSHSYSSYCVKITVESFFDKTLDWFHISYWPQHPTKSKIIASCICLDIYTPETKKISIPEKLAVTIEANHTMGIINTGL